MAIIYTVSSHISSFTPYSYISAATVLIKYTRLPF